MFTCIMMFARKVYTLLKIEIFVFNKNKNYKNKVNL